MTDRQSSVKVRGISVAMGKPDMRVFCGALCHATNTFSPVSTEMESFHDRLFATAHTLAMDRREAWPAPLQIFREYCRENAWHLIQGLCAGALSGGLVPRAVYESLRDTLLTDLKAVLPVDMVALGLHGAMTAEGYSDCEGDILCRIRRLVGPDIPVGAVLEARAHLTPTMTQSATMLVFRKDYPYSDSRECARRLMENLAATARGEVQPVASVFDCRMIGLFHTNTEPMRGFVSEMRDVERQDGVLSVSLIHGFPWSELPVMGTKVLVYTDNGSEIGVAHAERLGQRLFTLRDQTLQHLPTIDQVLAGLQLRQDGLIVLADTCDNPGSGAPGDSTFIARALLDAGVDRAAVAPIWDPMAVRTAFAHGEGAEVKLRIGGKASTYSGLPLDLNVTVVRLRRDACQILDGWALPMGDTALLKANGIELVVTSRRLECVNTDIFTNVGIDLASRSVVVVKSAENFLPAFRPPATPIIYVETPGILKFDANPSRYRSLNRPKWPFDGDPFHGQRELGLIAAAEIKDRYPQVIGGLSG